MNPREYVLKKCEDGSLATRWSRLADVNSGSAVKTNRQLQMNWYADIEFQVCKYGFFQNTPHLNKIFVKRPSIQI